MSKRSQQIIDAVLRAHDADVDKNGLLHFDERAVRSRHSDPVHIRAISHDEYFTWINATSSDVDLTIGFIRRDNKVRQLEVQLFQNPECLIDDRPFSMPLVVS